MTEVTKLQMKLYKLAAENGKESEIGREKEKEETERKREKRERKKKAIMMN